LVAIKIEKSQLRERQVSWKGLDIVHIEVKLRQKHKPIVRRSQSLNIVDLILPKF
jgi:hypothetical protein